MTRDEHAFPDRCECGEFREAGSALCFDCTPLCVRCGQTYVEHGMDGCFFEWPGATLEVGSVAVGRVVEVLGPTLREIREGPYQRALVWDREFHLTRLVFLEGWTPTRDEHVADCMAVRVLDIDPPPHLFRPENRVPEPA